MKELMVEDKKRTTVVRGSKGGPGSGNHGHAGLDKTHGGSSTGGGWDQNFWAEVEEMRAKEGSAKPKVEEKPKKRPSPDSLNVKMVNFLTAGIAGDLSTKTRSSVKSEIVAIFAEKTGNYPDEVNKILSLWASDSNKFDTEDDTGGAGYLQIAAKKAFGVELSDWQEEYLSSTSSGVLDKVYQAVFGPRNVEFLKSMYEHTQQQLKEAGFEPDDLITLYRGGSPDWDNDYTVGENVSYLGNALESWSVDLDVAHIFGPVMKIEVPVKNIASTARTGIGCLPEGEVVILGSKQKYTATFVGSRPEDTGYYDDNNNFIEKNPYEHDLHPYG